MIRCPMYITEDKRCCETFDHDETLRDHLATDHQERDVLNRLIAFVDNIENGYYVDIEDLL